ncbi:squalene synthase HpnD [Nonomuraea sp. PA05]|uniref:phytoene/squalene synthase family protein n=1 Tax=Nonomuraea sp. PA05 TaxID=2604466 RepID=UPI0011D2F2C9|nr:squalene/phytoene synthase family protein [Nonomuraea sp. PA05]TYB50773.1 squalene synthase HpnD [Nonomuraea sp. PA05]
MTPDGRATAAVDAAYAWCERTTWREARNFAYGIWLLPARQRRAMCAVYALARRIDDIGDGTLPPHRKLAHLQRVREQIGHLDEEGGRGAEDGRVLAAVADATRRFGLPLRAFADLVDGVEMDVRGTRYATWPDLALYCHRVAGTIGRLSVAVFQAADRERADTLADSLGTGLQVTNILRDLREDLACGRHYLPAEDVARFGCTGTPAPTPAFAELVRFQAARADGLMRDGLRLLPLIGRRQAACVAAMSGVYRAVLRRIARDPLQVLERRVTVPGLAKTGVAARALLLPDGTGVKEIW